MDDRVVIALFRHGLTEENKRKAYLGWNDSPLCPETINLTITRKYECYFSSDLRRCVDMTKILFQNSNPLLIQELREMNFGNWEGKTYEDLKEDLLYQHWLSEPFRHCPPEGESFQEFAKRIRTGWKRMIQEILIQGISSCALVTHGGVIRYLLSQFAPVEKEFWSWHAPHDQGFELIFDKEALKGEGRCTLLLEVPLMGNGHG